jgi:RNA polymerase sigma factor (sigma-70 family)
MLYEGLFDYAMKIAFRYIHQQEEAEEMVHESFIKLFKGWFKRIIVNTCIDQLRKVQLNIIHPENDSDYDHMGDTQETGLDRMAYQEIIEAIRQLTPVYRTVFNLFVIEGFSHDEIAQTLGISIGASKSNLSKAKSNLRKIISQRNIPTNYV